MLATSDLAAILCRLGSFYFDEGNLDKGEQNFKYALQMCEMCEMSHSPEDPFTLAMVRTVSQVNTARGKRAEIIELVST
jgi:hypothetical protein